MKFTLEIISAIFGGLAALLWFMSARVKTPTSFSITVHVANTPSHLAIGPYQTSYGESAELNALGKAVVRQSKLSSLAALCAGLAAAFQTITILTPS
jgi:hypothetical protein